MLKSNLILRRGEELTVHFEDDGGKVVITYPILGNPGMSIFAPKEEKNQLPINTAIPLTTENMV